MMRMTVLFLGLFLTANVAFANPPEGYPFVSFDEGLRLAKEQNRPIFLYFGRLGCGWCDKTNKESFSNAELRKHYIQHYVLVYVDSESGKRLRLPSGERITEADLGVRYQAFATPLFLFLDPQGKEIARIPGFKTTQDFEDYDRFMTGGYYKTQTLMQFLAGKP